MFRILLADDQPPVRNSVYNLLVVEPDVLDVVLAQDGAEAIDLSRQSHLDAVVLDIAMPVMNGIQALTQLQQEQPRLPVVMFSNSIGASTVRRCMRLGARGFVAKESAFEELMAAIRTVVRGQTYLCQVVLRSIATDGKG
jgi:DNA-binding NarL/FixJ family response regulator